MNRGRFQTDRLKFVLVLLHIAVGDPGRTDLRDPLSAKLRPERGKKPNSLNQLPRLPGLHADQPGRLSWFWFHHRRAAAGAKDRSKRCKPLGLAMLAG